MRLLEKISLLAFIVLLGNILMGFATIGMKANSLAAFSRTWNQQAHAR